MLSADFCQKSLGLERLNMPIVQMKHPFVSLFDLLLKNGEKRFSLGLDLILDNSIFKAFFSIFSLFYGV